jgi:hypothetical protein
MCTSKCRKPARRIRYEGAQLRSEHLGTRTVNRYRQLFPVVTRLHLQARAGFQRYRCRQQPSGPTLAGAVFARRRAAVKGPPVVGRRRIVELQPHPMTDGLRLCFAQSQARKHAIEVFYLPAYSTALSPDDNLNCDLKAVAHFRAPLRNADHQPGHGVLIRMRKPQKLPARAGRYFKHPKIAYAAG